MGCCKSKKRPRDLIDLDSKMDFLEHSLVIQCCINCSKHYGYTRHVEVRYQERIDWIKNLLSSDKDT